MPSTSKYLDFKLSQCSLCCMFSFGYFRRLRFKSRRFGTLYRFHLPSTRRFITAFTTVRHLSLPWASPIQSIYPHATCWRSILILSTHLQLGLPSGLLPSGFPSKTLYTPLSSPIRATCPAHLILLDFITRTLLENAVVTGSKPQQWR